MASNTQLSLAAKNTSVAAITSLIDGGGAGTLKVYSGSQPAGPNTAISSQVLLVSCALSSTAFGPPTNGVATANPIAPGNPTSAGTATWARIFSGAGTAVIDCTVGTSNTDIIVATSAIALGQPFAPSSLTISQP